MSAVLTIKKGIDATKCSKQNKKMEDSYEEDTEPFLVGIIAVKKGIEIANNLVFIGI